MGSRSTYPRRSLRRPCNTTMQLPCSVSQFLVKPDTTIDLGQWPTAIPLLTRSKSEYRKRLGEFRQELSELQSLLYAHNRYALLLIFQGIDTAGKGGAIKHVMSGVNPQGCQVFSFGPPSQEELDHDFLWRTNKRLPERGRIGIFDRSYYEEVLIVRVEPAVLAKQRLPTELVNPDTIWQQRFADIAQLESYLYRNGTRTVKFFLHLSKQVQRKRLLARIDDPEKNWKFTLHDLHSRSIWNDYQRAFADCLSHTSSEQAPWYIVPADSKRNARLIVSQIVVETLKTLKMDYPLADADHLQLLRQARSQLKADA